MGFVRFVLLIVLIILLGASLYLLYLNFPTEPVEYKMKDISINGNGEEIVEANYGSSSQFYDNMRFKKRDITYKIEKDCDSKKVEEVRTAFGIIDKETILSFRQESVNPEITVFCSEIAPDIGEEGYFVAGEGGPTEVINTSLYGVILSAKISFFRDEKCDTPNIAVHELLHALGFDHNNNPNSILYPTLNCEQGIDKSIIEDIDALYAIEGAADLKIVELDASKGGRYLNFKIEVINQGLEDADDVSLRVYADGKFVKDFQLEDVDIGTRKFLEVSNLKLPSRTSKNILFIVDEENNVKEIFESNNKLELSLEGG